MYDLLDRPVAELPATDRSLLAAMRGWVHALTLGGDPADAAARALPVGPGAAAETVAAFDRAMRALDRGCPGHDRVDDAEAVLLAIWRQVRGAGTGQAETTLRLLVDAPAAAEAVSAMAEVSALLAPAPAVRG